MKFNHNADTISEAVGLDIKAALKNVVKTVNNLPDDDINVFSKRVEAVIGLEITREELAVLTMALIDRYMLDDAEETAGKSILAKFKEFVARKAEQTKGSDQDIEVPGTTIVAKVRELTDGKAKVSLESEGIANQISIDLADCTPEQRDAVSKFLASVNNAEEMTKEEYESALKGEGGDA